MRKKKIEGKQYRPICCPTVEEKALEPNNVAALIISMSVYLFRTCLICIQYKIWVSCPLWNINASGNWVKMMSM